MTEIKHKHNMKPGLNIRQTQSMLNVSMLFWRAAVTRLHFNLWFCSFATSKNNAFELSFTRVCTTYEVKYFVCVCVCVLVSVYICIDIIN